MSLYYLTVRNITKATQSAVAASSYRSGEALYSDRDQETKSYNTRLVMPETHILAPSHAPEWVYNREYLWNEVERAERNWNSRLAREVLVALPIELSDKDQTEMLLEFVKENFSDKGMVADVSIHRDKVENPHAHIMLTVRPFNEDGTWGNKRIKNEEGKWIHSVDWNDKDSLLNWRKNYAEKVNEFYQKFDLSERISHESYQAQGLDKLPKQRLSREEYAIEKREKENALKNGREYQPKTYYGQLNNEIDKANKTIELNKQKVVSLADYREKYVDNKLNEFNKIRKGIELSDQDWKSLKIVANRLNGFVDLQSSKDNLNKLENWKRSIEKQKLTIAAEEKVLMKAKLSFDKEPKQVMLYGFNPGEFNKTFAEKVNEFTDRKIKLDSSVEAFENLYNSSVRTYDIQKQFTNEEFAYLYPEYAKSFNVDNEKIIGIKEKYVEQFRSEIFVRDSIPEFDTNLEKFAPENIRLEMLLNDWKETTNSLLILERTKEKHKREYSENYKEYDADKVYNSSVKYNQSMLAVAEKEGVKDTLKKQLSESLISRYKDASIELINSIPSDVQYKILELHLGNKHTGILSEDLTIVRDQESKISNSRNANNLEDRFKRSDKDNQFDQNVSSGSSSGDIFNSLIASAQDREKGYDDEEQRRKRKQKKLYRDIGEYEI